MLVSTILEKLLLESVSLDGQVHVPYDQVKKELINLGETSVNWDVSDFEGVAESRKGDQWPLYYDAEKFDEALRLMIYRHDAEVGICWETVSYYLEMFCTRKQPGKVDTIPQTKTALQEI